MFNITLHKGCTNVVNDVVSTHILNFSSNIVYIIATVL